MLAGVSEEYYSRLEHGDAAGVSESILDAIAGALVPWAITHEGPPPVEAVDRLAAAAFARLAELDVPRETGGRPPGRARG